MSRPYLRIPFIFNYSTLFLLALALIIARCKKNDKEDPPDNETSGLSVQFSSSSIPFNMVDSAVAFLTKENTTSPVKKLMEKKDGHLTTSLEDLANGNWAIRIYVYSRVGGDNYPRRYDLVKTVTLNADANIEYPAPAGQLQGEWKTRVILAETDKSIVLTVALDPADPYYDMQAQTSQWDYVYIDRTAVYQNTDGSQHNDGGSWECDNECFQNGQLHFDPTSFSDFSQRMNNRIWVRTETFSTFLNTATGQERTFYYSYTK